MLLCACRVLVLVSALSVLTQNAAVAGQSIGRPDVIGNVKAGLFSRPVWPSSYKVMLCFEISSTEDATEGDISLGGTVTP